MANNPFDSQKYQNFLNWFKDCKSNPYNQNTYLFGEGLSYYEQLSSIGSFLYDLKEYITTSDWATGEELQAIIDQIEAEKQNVLISGENIKTINSESILSAGNLDLQEKLIAGQNIVISPDGKTISASGTVGIDYPNVSNKPQINGHTLQSGNNTLDTLGIQAKDETILFESDVVNNLLSEDTNAPLSANQGRILDEQKQNKLISGADIKTLNDIPLLGEGNIPFKTVGSESIFGSGNIAFKTINSQSLMGEGNMPLQEVLTAGTGIDITNNVISNQFDTLVNPDLDTIKYNYQGYLYGGTNTPSGANTAGMLCSIFRKGTADGGLQIYVPYISDDMYYRRCSASTFQPWIKIQNNITSGSLASPDLNTLTEPLMCYVTNATNCPSNDSKYGYLYVNRRNSSNVQQLYCPANTHMVFERQLFNSAWTSWEELTTTYHAGDVYYPRDNIITGYGYISNGQARLTINLPKQVVASSVSLSGSIRVITGSGITADKSISSYSYTTSVESGMGAVYLNLKDFNTVESLSLPNGTVLLVLFVSGTFRFA